MEEYLLKATPWAFWTQLAVFISPIPLTYIAYKRVRAPLKSSRVKSSLSQLGIIQTQEVNRSLHEEYHLNHYIWPLVTSILTVAVTFSITHVYVIQTNLWVGILEEVIDLYGENTSLFRDIISGRLWFYAFCGAWLYSIGLLARRYLSYDLTPSVFFFINYRFLLAFLIGAVIIVGLGPMLIAAGMPLNLSLSTVAVISFFVGFFPEQGLNWIIATGQKALKRQGGVSKEVSLSEIEGLSIWQQGRLRQEGIDNAQNLATADIVNLVTGPPFTLSQIIDWVDQAILLSQTNNGQFEALEKAGVIRASEMLTNANSEEGIDDLADATGLKKSELRILFKNMQSALNLKLIVRYRWQSSLDEGKVEEAKQIILPDVHPVVTDKIVTP